MVGSVSDSDSGSDVETSPLGQSVDVKHPVCWERGATETESDDQSEDETRGLQAAGKWRHRPGWYSSDK